MPIFQKSVLKKHLKDLNDALVEKAHQTFLANYTPSKIEKIKTLKEEEYQDGFLRDLFVDVFGYTLKPNENHNLVREFKNQTDSKKADGAILKEEKAIAIIELKSTKTKDLTKVTQQAFNYKNNQPECKYVITSNFQKLRFYIDYANEYEEFDLFQLTKERFKLLYLLLCKESILSNLPLQLKDETKFHEQEISDKLYKDYSKFKRKLYENLTKNHPNSDKLTLFKKSQKLLDRFLFILFAEDSGLLPPNSISEVIKRFNVLKENDAYKPVYEIFKQYFGYMNIGRKGKTTAGDIPAYNGGLFYTDKELDAFKIDDEILIDDLLNLSEYDFSTEVDVNILGHIFEHSLNEIEEITAEIEGTAADKTKSKRKKDGVFYTPKYITQYIVENTVGTLCNEKRKELHLEEIEFDGTYRTKSGKLSEKGKKLYKQLTDYKDWLITLKIIDPACGSGAFLNQTLNFLIEEHTTIDDIIAELTNSPLRLFDVDKTILENNLFGVDINEESVDIARLSLWLRTAQKGRKLSSLNNNIKCGNSLIDDPKIAGDKAFHWQTEFPQIFKEKEKKPHHITWVTHNSRTSQRMIDYKVKKGAALWLDNEWELNITKTIAEIIKQDNLNVLAYNICGDHIHLLLVCVDEEVPNIIRKLKGKSSQKLKEHLQIPKEEQFTLWAQKYSNTYIDTEEKFNNTISYIQTNRQKHNLDTHTSNKGLQPLDNKPQPLDNKLQPLDNKLQPLVDEMCCSYKHAFRTEYNGGFDCVIGNPPYVDIKALDGELVKGLFKYYKTTENRINLYSIFIEKAYDLAKSNGFVSFINPNSILVNSSYKKIRTLLIDEMTKIIKLPDDVFIDAKVETIIFEYRKNNKDKFIEVLVYPKSEKIEFVDNSRMKTIEKTVWKNDENLNYNIFLSIDDINLLNKIKQNSSNELGNISDFCLGITPYDKYQGHSPETIKTRAFHSIEKLDSTYKPLITGENMLRFNVTNESKEYIKYGNWLGAMREERFFTSPRIIVRQIVSGKPPRIYAGYTEEALYFTQIGFSIIPKEKDSIKYILTLINSKLITYYHKYQYLDIEKDLFQKILIANCKQLPIKEIPQEAQQPFIEKAEIILSLNEKFYTASSKFTTYLQSQFAIEKLPKKLQNWHELDFGDFIKELNKAIKKENKQRVATQQGDASPYLIDTLNKLQEMEWMEVFETKKAEAQTLKTEIDKTDKEIDQMVYELYELTEEEIKIVEQ